MKYILHLEITVFKNLPLAAPQRIDSKWEFESDNEDDYLEKHSYFAEHDMDAQSIYGFEQTSQIRRRESMAPAMLLSRTKSEGNFALTAADPGTE